MGRMGKSSVIGVQCGASCGNQERQMRFGHKDGPLYKRKKETEQDVYHLIIYINSKYVNTKQYNSI